MKAKAAIGKNGGFRRPDTEGTRSLAESATVNTKIPEPTDSGKLQSSSEKEETDMAGKTIKIGRDAKNGQFIPVKEAEKRPNTTIVQKIKR